MFGKSRSFPPRPLNDNYEQPRRQPPILPPLPNLPNYTSSSTNNTPSAGGYYNANYQDKNRRFNNNIQPNYNRSRSKSPAYNNYNRTKSPINNNNYRNNNYRSRSKSPINYRNSNIGNSIYRSRSNSPRNDYIDNRRSKSPYQGQFRNRSKSPINNYYNSKPTFRHSPPRNSPLPKYYPEYPTPKFQTNQPNYPDHKVQRPNVPYRSRSRSYSPRKPVNQVRRVTDDGAEFKGPLNNFRRVSDDYGRDEFKRKSETLPYLPDEALKVSEYRPISPMKNVPLDKSLDLPTRKLSRSLSPPPLPSNYSIHRIPSPLSFNNTDFSRRVSNNSISPTLVHSSSEPIRGGYGRGVSPESYRNNFRRPNFEKRDSYDSNLPIERTSYPYTSPPADNTGYSGGGGYYSANKPRSKFGAGSYMGSYDGQYYNNTDDMDPNDRFERPVAFKERPNYDRYSRPNQMNPSKPSIVDNFYKSIGMAKLSKPQVDEKLDIDKKPELSPSPIVEEEPEVSREELLLRIDKLDGEINVLESKLDRVRDAHVVQNEETEVELEKERKAKENSINSLNSMLTSINSEYSDYNQPKHRYFKALKNGLTKVNAQLPALIATITSENKCRAAFSNHKNSLEYKKLFDSVPYRSASVNIHPEDVFKVELSKNAFSKLKYGAIPVESQLTCKTEEECKSIYEKNDEIKADIFSDYLHDIEVKMETNEDADVSTLFNRIDSFLYKTPDNLRLYPTFADYPLYQETISKSLNPKTIAIVYNALLNRQNEFFSKCCDLYKQRLDLTGPYLNFLKNKNNTKAGKLHLEAERKRNQELERLDTERANAFATIMASTPGNRQTTASTSALQFALQGSSSSLEDTSGVTLLQQLENAVYQNLAPKSNRVDRSGEQEDSSQLSKSSKNNEATLSKLYDEERKRRRVEINFIPKNKIPNMLLIPTERQHFDTFLNRNGFIEDAMQDERDRKNNNPWTDEEKTIFEQRYVKFPKRFHKIAEGLPNKTVNECVSYYYASKHSVNYKKLVRFGGRKMNRAGKPRCRELANLGVDVPSTSPQPPLPAEEEEESTAIGSAFGGGFKGVSTFSLYGPAPSSSSNNDTIPIFCNNSILPIAPDVFPIGVVDFKHPQVKNYLMKKCAAYEPIQISSLSKNSLTVPTRRGFTGKLKKLEIGLPAGETVVKLKQRLKLQNKTATGSGSNANDKSNSLQPTQSSVAADGKNTEQYPSNQSSSRPALSNDDMAILTLAKHIISSNPYFFQLIFIIFRRMKHWKDYELETFILSLTLFESDFNKISAYLYSQNQSNKTSEQCQELWELIYKNLPLVALAMSTSSNYQNNQDVENLDQIQDSNSVVYEEDVERNNDFENNQPLNRSSSVQMENYRDDQEQIDNENDDVNINEENLNDNNEDSLIDNNNENNNSEGYDDDSYDEDNLENEYEFVDRENGEAEDEFYQDEDLEVQNGKTLDNNVKLNSTLEIQIESDGVIPDSSLGEIKQPVQPIELIETIPSFSHSELTVTDEPLIQTVGCFVTSTEEPIDENILRKRVASEIESDVNESEDNQNKKRCI